MGCLRVPEPLLECPYSRYILKANGDALHWKKVYVVNIISLVVKKAVNIICDEPQIQRVKRKSLGTVQQAWRLFFMYILVFYSDVLDF